MIPDLSKIINNEDKTVNNTQLNFSFITQTNTLFIQATTTTSKHTQKKYVSKIQTNPLIQFDTIRQILEQNEYKIINKTQDLIKLAIGPLTVKLVSTTSNQPNLQQTIQYQLRQKNRESFQNFDQQKQQKQQLQQSIQQCQDLAINDKRKVLMKDRRPTKNEFKVTPSFSIKIYYKQLEKQFGKSQHSLNNSFKLKQQTVNNNNANSIQINNNNNQQHQQEKQQQSLQDSKRYKFSLTQKSQRTTIIKSHQAIKSYGSKYSSFVLFDQQFNTYLHQLPKYWAIKYTKKVDWIGIGICLKQTSRLSEKYFNGRYYNWEQLGHACYMICSDKYCYSHSQRAMNFVQKGFNIEQGDVVFVEYNTEEMFIKFQLNCCHGKVIKMTIIQPEISGDMYVPFVSLYGCQQTVEIVNGERFT